jgi:hypothetical protein
MRPLVPLILVAVLALPIAAAETPSLGCAPVRAGIGANWTVHDTPSTFDLFYGDDPQSRAVFLRLRLIGG